MSLKPPSAAVRSQHGAALLLAMLLLFLLLLPLMQPAWRSPSAPLDETGQALHVARRALLHWATARQHQGKAPLSMGLLPYPDRDGDGNYDGTADCLSGSGLGQEAWRIGRLPFRGERWPCEGRALYQPEARDDAEHATRQVLRSLQVEMPDGPLWYAASINVLDDDRMGRYPDASVAQLMSLRSGWLTLCRQDGALLAQDLAFIVIAPGPALPGQRRRARAPSRQHFLEGQPLQGSAPCHRQRESNADGDRVFVAPSHQHDLPAFNDRLLPVSRREYASHLARVQALQIARWLQEQWPPPAAAGEDGRCQPGRLHGALPVIAAPECPLAAGIPSWLLPAARDNPHYRQLTYERDSAGQRVWLSFTGCAMRFEITRREIRHALPFC